MANTSNTHMTEIQCHESLDISLAVSLRQTLKNALDAGNAIRLQAQQVTRADTAALQLLVAFMYAARQRGITVSWYEPSAVLCRSALLLGLTQALDIPSHR